MIFHKGTNSAALIKQKYFDYLRCEFCSVEDIIKRYPRPEDYYLCYDTYSTANNTQTLLWAYSREYFNVFELEDKLYEIGFNI